MAMPLARLASKARYAAQETAVFVVFAPFPYLAWSVFSQSKKEAQREKQGPADGGSGGGSGDVNGSGLKSMLVTLGCGVSAVGAVMLAQNHLLGRLSTLRPPGTPAAPSAARRFFSRIGLSGRFGPLLVGGAYLALMAEYLFAYSRLKDAKEDYAAVAQKHLQQEETTTDEAEEHDEVKTKSSSGWGMRLPFFSRGRAHEGVKPKAQTDDHKEGETQKKVGQWSASELPPSTTTSPSSPAVLPEPPPSPLVKKLLRFAEVAYQDLQKRTAAAADGQTGSQTDSLVHSLDLYSTVATIVLLGPAAEEALFRGLLFPRLLVRSGPLWAYPISSGLFAAAHVPFSYRQLGVQPENEKAALAFHTFMGVCCAAAYHVTGGLVAPLLLHALHNGVTMGSHLEKVADEYYEKLAALEADGSEKIGTGSSNVLTAFVARYPLCGMVDSFEVGLGEVLRSYGTLRLQYYRLKLVLHELVNPHGFFGWAPSSSWFSVGDSEFCPHPLLFDYDHALLPTGEFRAALEALFSRMDKDGDGLVSLSELLEQKDTLRFGATRPGLDLLKFYRQKHAVIVSKGVSSSEQGRGGGGEEGGNTTTERTGITRDTFFRAWMNEAFFMPRSVLFKLHRAGLWDDAISRDTRYRAHRRGGGAGVAASVAGGGAG